MKKIFILPVLVMLFANSFGQKTTKAVYTKEEYLQKSKSQQTTGWILLGSGTMLTVIGAASFGDLTNGDDTGGYLFVGGVLAAAASVPFLISSSVNKRRSTTFNIKKQKIFLPNKSSMAICQTAISVEINF